MGKQLISSHLFFPPVFLFIHRRLALLHSESYKMSHGLATMNLSAEPKAINKPRLRLPWKKVSEDIGNNRAQDLWHESFEQIRAMNDVQQRVLSGTQHTVAQVRIAKVIIHCWGLYPRLRALRLK